MENENDISEKSENENSNGCFTVEFGTCDGCVTSFLHLIIQCIVFLPIVRWVLDIEWKWIFIYVIAASLINIIVHVIIALRYEYKKYS